MLITQKLKDFSGLLSYLYELDPNYKLNLPRTCPRIIESISNDTFPNFTFSLDEIDDIHKDLLFLQISDTNVNLFLRESYKRKLLNFKKEFSDTIKNLTLCRDDILLLTDLPFFTDEYINDKYTSPFIRQSLASGSIERIKSKEIGKEYQSSQWRSMSKNIFLPESFILKNIRFMDVYEIGKNPLLSEETFEKILTRLDRKPYHMVRAFLCGLSCNRNIHYLSPEFIEKYGISPNPISAFCRTYRFENETINMLIEKINKIK